MEKVLSQAEIDAMVEAARSGAPLAPQPNQPHIERWDVHHAGQIGREQLQTITQLHEAFARNLTHSLGAYLRIPFTAALVSAEHLTYREFLQSVPETTYLASCRLDPTGLNAALQLDLSVALPIIDLLLGGEGKALENARPITEIEEQILAGVSRIVCRELSMVWQPLSLEIIFDGRLDTSGAQRLMPSDEKTLSLSFEITMPELRGGLNLAIPAAVSNALLRKISDEWSRRRPRPANDFRQRLMQRLLDCPFRVELRATRLRLPVSALADLNSGQVLEFARPAADPAALAISGAEVFRALPARCGANRAARVLAPLTSPERTTAPKENAK